MRVIVYALNSFCGTVWFGFLDVGKSLWTGIACYLMAGFILSKAFILKLDALNEQSNVKHQLFVLMVLFALFCFYLGGYLIYKSKRNEQ
jgi:uncharacterized membrane protein